MNSKSCDIRFLFSKGKHLERKEKFTTSWRPATTFGYKNDFNSKKLPRHKSLVEESRLYTYQSTPQAVDK